jgi:glutaredoxin-like protein
MMGLLDEATLKEVKKTLSSMNKEVEILFFESEGQFTNETKQLLQEISEVTSKIKLSLYKVGDEDSLKHDITEGPVIKLKSEYIKGDFRMYGIPSGYEFPIFLHMLKLSSNGKIDGPLVDVSKKIVNELKLEVFVSPSCPHCPSSAIVAFKLAVLNDKVKGYVYEVMEFQEKVHKYNVSGVPKTVINEGKFEYMGGLPEDMVSKEILKTI